MTLEFIKETYRDLFREFRSDMNIITINYYEESPEDLFAEQKDLVESTAVKIGDLYDDLRRKITENRDDPMFHEMAEANRSMSASIGEILKHWLILLQ